MRLTSRGIDEYTLAAYLAGRLSPSRHEEVADFLAENEDARDLLFDASQLLEAEGDGQDARVRPSLTAVNLPPRRQPLLSGSRRLSVLLWTTVTLVCVTAFVTTVLVAFRVGVEAGTKELAAPQSELTRMIAVSGGFEALQWRGDPEAATYTIVIFDDEAARVVGQVETDIPYISYDTVQGYLGPDTSRRVWIDAFDAGGKLLARSRSVLLED